MAAGHADRSRAAGSDWEEIERAGVRGGIHREAVELAGQRTIVDADQRLAGDDPADCGAGERCGRRAVEADQGCAVGRERDGRNAGEVVLDREAAGGRDAVEEGADQRGGAAEQVDAVETDCAGDGQQRVTGAGGHRVVGRRVDAARDVEAVGIGEVDAERADRILRRRRSADFWTLRKSLSASSV